MDDDAPRVFISRRLEAGSAFARMLRQAGLQVDGRSLIEFKALAGWHLLPSDWIFFSSRRAVHFFFAPLPDNALPESVRLAALGPGTADALSKLGRAVAFQGSGEPKATARLFAEQARGMRVLFPRARQSRRSVQRWLGEAVQQTDLVVYDNQPSKQLPTQAYDILVFTSPLNAQAWFAQRQLQTGQKVVAIGQTTAKALRQLGLGRLSVADQPTEAALAQTVLGLTDSA